MGGTAKGKGEVDAKKVKEIADVWGKLPEKERARAMVELTRGMPAKDRAVIEHAAGRLDDGGRAKAELCPLAQALFAIV